MSSTPATVTITDAKIQSALDPKLSVDESLNILLEASEIKSGQAVAILDGSAYGIDGIKGVAKGPAGKSGFINVELPNKTQVPIPANLLLPV